MGCNVSKQMKDKKLLPGSSRRPRSKSPSRRKPANVTADNTTTVNAPAKQVHSEPGPYSEPLSIDKNLPEQTLQTDAPTTSPGSASGTTNSGNSPVASCGARSVEVLEPDHKMSPKAIFDEEVLLALAAVDVDEQVRQEAAFRAILRSLST